MITSNDVFGDVVYSYTRKQALADGGQVDVTKAAKEAGFLFPVFITRGVYDECVAVPPDVSGQDEAGRLWDVIWMLRVAILRVGKNSQARLPVLLYVRKIDSQPPKLTKLIAAYGAVDIDDPKPSITVMLPDED